MSLLIPNSIGLILVLVDKKIINHIKKIDDPYPYFRGLLSEITSDIKLIKFHQPDRKAGKTKNNFYSLYDIGILGIIKHSKLPFRIMTFVGFVTSILSILVAIIFFFYKILYWDSFELGIAPIIIGFFGIASVQLFFLGFIGEYVMNILVQTRKLPLVIEKERINFWFWCPHMDSSLGIYFNFYTQEMNLIALF